MNNTKVLSEKNLKSITLKQNVKKVSTQTLLYLFLGIMALMVVPM